MKPLIPIIILNWNGLADTLECMEAVLAQDYPNFRVYLVDNGSEDGSPAQLQQKFGQVENVRLIFNKDNLGFTKGNNVIIEQLLKSEENLEFIALLNNDTAVEKNWLSALYDSAVQHKADMVASKMINYFNRKVMDNAGHRMLNTAEIIPIGNNAPIEEYEAVFDNMGSCAGATLYSTRMLKDIGIFDDYFETGYEDAELGVRANVLGYRTIYEPSAIVYHKVSQSVNKIRNFNYLQKVQVNIFYSYFKLMPFAVILINLPFFIFKYGILFIIDIVFLRFKFLKVLVGAIGRVLTKERQHILNSRKAIYKQHQAVSSIDILKKMEFFLWFDIKRFFKHIVFREKTHFEKY